MIRPKRGCGVGICVDRLCKAVAASFPSTLSINDHARKKESSGIMVQNDEFVEGTGSLRLRCTSEMM